MARQHQDLHVAQRGQDARHVAADGVPLQPAGLHVGGKRLRDPLPHVMPGRAQPPPVCPAAHRPPPADHADARRPHLRERMDGGRDHPRDGNPLARRGEVRQHRAGGIAGQHGMIHPVHVAQVAQEVIQARGQHPPRHLAVRGESGVRQVDGAGVRMPRGEETEESQPADAPVQDGEPHG